MHDAINNLYDRPFAEQTLFNTMLAFAVKSVGTGMTMELEGYSLAEAS